MLTVAARAPEPARLPGEPALPFGPLDPEGDRTLELGAARLGARADRPRARLRRAALHLRRPRPPPRRATTTAARVLSVAYLALVRETTRRRSPRRALARLVRAASPGRTGATAGPQLIDARPVAAARASGRGARRRASAASGASGSRSSSASAARAGTASGCSSATSCSTRPGSSRGAARPSSDARRRGGARRASRRADPARPADGARPPPHPRHRARPAARQAQVPAGGLRAAAARPSRCCSSSGWWRRWPASACTSRTSGAWSRAAGWSRAPAGYTRTGGRPAELFRFRREVLRERPAPGRRACRGAARLTRRPAHRIRACARLTAPYTHA